MNHHACVDDLPHQCFYVCGGNLWYHTACAGYLVPCMGSAITFHFTEESVIIAHDAFSETNELLKVF
jgi:hypothetical protein